MDLDFSKIEKMISYKSFLNLLEINLGKKQKPLERVKSKKIIVVGDLHGDFDSLLYILKNVDLEEKNLQLIFLGDYGDRGKYQIETYYLLLKLRAEYSKKVLMLRGNHEFVENYEPYPHDLPLVLLSRFPRNQASEIYSLIKNFWECLSFSAISKKYFFVHGGIPVNFESIKEIENPNLETKLQLLWNDPMEENGIERSYRGIGYLFGPNITNKFLEKSKVEKIIRAHEPCNGFKFNHCNKVLTIFSMKGYYGNKEASFLMINEKEKIVTF